MDLSEIKASRGWGHNTGREGPLLDGTTDAGVRHTVLIMNCQALGSLGVKYGSSIHSEKQQIQQATSRPRYPLVTLKYIPHFNRKEFLQKLVPPCLLQELYSDILVLCFYFEMGFLLTQVSLESPTKPNLTLTVPFSQMLGLDHSERLPFTF